MALLFWLRPSLCIDSFPCSPWSKAEEAVGNKAEEELVMSNVLDGQLFAEAEISKAVVEIDASVDVVIEDEKVLEGEVIKENDGASMLVVDSVVVV